MNSRITSCPSGEATWTGSVCGESRGQATSQQPHIAKNRMRRLITKEGVLAHPLFMLTLPTGDYAQL